MQLVVILMLDSAALTKSFVQYFAGHKNTDLHEYQGHDNALDSVSLLQQICLLVLLLLLSSSLIFCRRKK